MIEESDTEFLGTQVVEGVVKPEWIDVNQHMNVAYYLLAFDLGVDSMWERYGITENYVNTSDSSTFAVESHITWQREMAEAEPYFITTQVLAYDEKRIHQFMRMYHARAGYLAATAEWLSLHVDLSVRRVAPWPERILAEIRRFADSQAKGLWPVEAGKTMNIANPLYSQSGQ